MPGDGRVVPGLQPEQQHSITLHARACHVPTIHKEQSLGASLSFIPRPHDTRNKFDCAAKNITGYRRGKTSVEEEKRKVLG